MQGPMITGFRVMEDRGGAWWTLAESWDANEIVKAFHEELQGTDNKLIVIDPRDNTLIEGWTTAGQKYTFVNQHRPD